MRKYDIKNKKYIGIVLGIALIIIIIFSIFLKKVIDAGKIEYSVLANSVVFDVDKNMITTDSESKLKVKWSGNYYMVYDESMINLGDHSVIYNLDNGNISLYGTYYEVLNTGDVDILKDENVIKSTVMSHFYKLDDRKYLIIDKTIESDDGLLVTSNYLIVNIDKSGNATFINNNINLKTFHPSVLMSSSFTFDIANEIINFGGEDIDLKEIIGSTNEYDKNKVDNDNSSVDGVTGGTGGSTFVSDTTGTIGSGNSTGNADTTSYYQGTYNSGVSDSAVSQIINATKNTSVIRVTTSLTSIGVDYVVYDPNNEFQSVYVEVEEANDKNHTSIVYLSKNDTNLTISDLKFNTLYNLYFKYTYYDDNGELKVYSFSEPITVGTKTPSMSLKVTGIYGNKLYYKVIFDDYYIITSGTFNVLQNGNYVASGSISTLGSVDEFVGSIDISNCDFSTGDSIVLSLYSISINKNTGFNPELSYQFVY